MYSSKLSFGLMAVGSLFMGSALRAADTVPVDELDLVSSELMLEADPSFARAARGGGARGGGARGGAARVGAPGHRAGTPGRVGAPGHRAGTPGRVGAPGHRAGTHHRVGAPGHRVGAPGHGGGRVGAPGHHHHRIGHGHRVVYPRPVPPPYYPPVVGAPTCNLSADRAEVYVGEEVRLRLEIYGSVSSASIDGLAVAVPLAEIYVQPGSAGVYSPLAMVSGPGGTNYCQTQFVAYSAD